MYPGPKPQSKETAIAMLGDAVESASRTLSSPSPERIRALIDELVTERVEQGELDECGLTFRDLGRVKQQFARVLTGLYHHRIDYPQPTAPLRPVSTETTIPSAADGAPTVEPAVSNGANTPVPSMPDTPQEPEPDLWSSGHGSTTEGARRRPAMDPKRRPAPLTERERGESAD